MSHILFAWELGEDLGHLARISVIAQELIARGHKVTVAIKDLSRASLFFNGTAISLMQSPLWLPQPTQRRLTKTIADILSYRGYGSIDGLTSLVQAWSSLVSAVSPDIIVCDYAPTAQIAASRLRIPRVVLSNSFSFPEPGNPGQDICPWAPAPIEAVRRNEQKIIDNINTVAARLRFPAIRYLPDIFSYEGAFITELPIFDSYRNSRHNAAYVGAVPSGHGFETVNWGSLPGKRVLVYLKPGRPKVDATLRLLRESGAIVRGYFAGQLPEDLQSSQNETFKLSNQPVNISASLEDADMAVFHGSIGTLCEIALSGKPAFALPTQIEQAFNSRLIREIGSGDWSGAQQAESELERRFQNFMMSESMRKNAQALAKEYTGFKDFPFSKTICDGVEAL